MVAQWLSSEEAALIEFLVAHKIAAGDGFNFKCTTWTEAAVHMVTHTEEGDPKTVDVCIV